MARIRHFAEQVINKLRQAEVLLGQGMKIPEVAMQLGVAARTYDRCRKEYGGLKTDRAKKLQDLDHKNFPLKKLVADLTLDEAMPQEVASGNF